MSDCPVGLFPRPPRMQKIFATAASLSPDVVVLAGDMIDDDPFFTTKLVEGANTLPQSIPLLAVLGNHEMYGAPREVIDRLRVSRIHLLVNEGTALRQLWIAGIS